MTCIDIFEWNNLGNQLEVRTKVPRAARGLQRQAVKRRQRDMVQPAFAHPRPLHSQPNFCPPQDNPFIVGACELMCPAAEVQERIRESDVWLFERDPLTREPDENRMVKKALRNLYDEDMQPSMIRTPGALGRTMLHLRTVMDSGSSFEDIHKFLWDRCAGSLCADDKPHLLYRVEDVRKFLGDRCGGRRLCAVPVQDLLVQQPHRLHEQ